MPRKKYNKSYTPRENNHGFLHFQSRQLIFQSHLLHLLALPYSFLETSGLLPDKNRAGVNYVISAYRWMLNYDMVKSLPVGEGEADRNYYSLSGI